MHPVLAKRLSKTILKNLGVIKDYSSSHLEDICKLKSLQSGSKTVLPKGVVAVNEYDKIAIYKEKFNFEFINYEYNLGEFDFIDKKAIISKDKLENSLFFDGDKIPKGAVIRTRKDGDVFTKFGGGTKKLKEYFIDKKIPKDKRDLIPLIALNNEVLLIFGVEISDKIKTTDSTKNYLYANIQKTN